MKLYSQEAEQQMPVIVSDDIDLSKAMELIEYNEETGLFYWKAGSNRPSRKAGTKTKSGYIRIQLGKKLIFAHRLAWLMTYGAYPSGYIDHINNNRSDNRIKNLRIVNIAENARNQKMHKNNTVGFTGVYWCKRYGGRWAVQIGFNGKRKHLGYFNSLIDAVAERIRAEKELSYFDGHGRKV